LNCHGLRWIGRAGAAWRLMPYALPPLHTVDQQSQRWLKAGVVEAIVPDRRAVWRLAQGRNTEPSAAICDSRTVQSTPASGTRAGYNGAKRRRSSKVYRAADIFDVGPPGANARKFTVSLSQGFSTPVRLPRVVAEMR